MLWPQNFKKYNLLWWDEGDFCLGGGGGLVVCRWGELGLGRRRRNITFSDDFTDGFFVGDAVGDFDVKSDTSPYGSGISNPSVIPSVF